MTRFEKLLLLLLVNVFRFWIDQSKVQVKAASYVNWTNIFVEEIHYDNDN